MQAFPTQRSFKIRLSASSHNFFCKVRVIAVLVDTLIQVDTADIVFSVKSVGKSNTAVFFCILASRVVIRPRRRVVASCKLTRMAVNKIFFKSSRFFVFSRSYDYPIRSVLHFFGNSFIKHFLSCRELVRLGFARLLIGLNTFTVNFLCKLINAQFVFFTALIVFKSDSKVRWKIKRYHIIGKLDHTVWNVEHTTLVITVRHTHKR